MKFFSFLLLVSTLSACSVLHSKQKKFDPVFSTEAGAIRGYDPVAYFTEGKPVPGQAAISYAWQGATWHFASTEHRTLFQKDPEKYAPAYGGYCAYGWSQGYPAPIDPTAWTMVDGTLYLNYDAGVKTDWDKKQPEYIQAANQHWKEAKSKQDQKN